MVNNPYRVGKTQWSKWNDAGRVAFNEAMDAGASVSAAIEMANATTQEAETERKNKKRGVFDVLGDVVETVTEVAQVATPVIAVAKTVVKATKGKKGK